ncbi:MAG: ABC transporter ATP-binding protein [Nitrososphaerota archaeon]|nr:ABC transporter ATP-binding protein [Nitrososphaerota archaeon]
MTGPVCRLEFASRVFDSGPEQVVAVKDATLSVVPGESVGIVGPSGSGKTTLLGLLGALRLPTRGEAFFQETNLRDLTDAGRRELRLKKVGFVFQQLRLIPALSAVENIQLPMTLSARHGRGARARALELAGSVGLGGKANRRPAQLSVGEQQRVAVARAIANDPALILADEPTSQLDSSSGRKIVDLLLSLRERIGAAVVISTHDPSVAKSLDHVYAMRDGVIAPGRNF